MGGLSRIIFGISPEEASFRTRGFKCRDERARARLEHVGRTFLHGYHAALEVEGAQLAARLDAVEWELRGFAFEGAAMGLALLDTLTPWRRTRLRTFVEGAGAAHAYMVFVGAGWSLARLRRGTARPVMSLDPLLGWLAVDGYGFHEGYFHWPDYVTRRKRPRRLKGYALRAFDQGLGRSLWFVEGADVEGIAATVEAFEVERRADLWSGVGLACAYAGGVEGEGIETLRVRAGRFAPQLAQGAAFAAKARQRAGNPAPHTDRACRVLCRLSAEAAARVTDEALRHLPHDGDEPAYEIWRRRIAGELARLKQAA
ncbi:MAG TPA: DUF1702 family protein [Pyrinomonadaceae bacterium]|jgi:hypothetical protein|nr:DUF1702 family protein [Pyrinomonadaceae bacterium]